VPTPVRDALAGLLARADSRDSAARLICEACSDLLPVTGAAISVIDEHQVRGTVCVSDTVMSAIEELQFTTGVGPCVDAFVEGRPVLVPDLAQEAEVRWPAFSAGAVRVGVRAIFAFPLQIGAVRLGALDMYRSDPGSLHGDALADALLVADASTAALVHMQEEEEEAAAPSGVVNGQWWDPSSVFHVVVHQATGMVMMQLDVSATDSLLRLRAAAFARGESVSDLARAVIRGHVRFGTDGVPTGESPA
jgi:hypothetical protein